MLLKGRLFAPKTTSLAFTNSHRELSQLPLPQTNFCYLWGQPNACMQC
jgi:hypothetical protein